MTEPIWAAMQPLKDAVEHYNRELVRVRDHQQAEDGKPVLLAQPGQTNWLQAEVSVIDLPKGVQLKWLIEIIDPNQVPNGYWVLNEAAIKTAVASGIRDIPGVRIYQQAVTTFRR